VVLFLLSILLGVSGCQSDQDIHQPPPSHQGGDDFASKNTVERDGVITLVADAWPPYNGGEDDELEGYMIDVAREVFGAEGYTVDYVIVPWKRALSGSLSGRYDGAVGTTKLEGAGLVFPGQELLRSRIAFYVRQDSAWKFSGPSSLDGVSLGVARGYDYTDWLNVYIVENESRPDRIQILEGHFPLRQNIRKLLAGRIDVMAGDEGCTRYTAIREGVLDQLTMAGRDPEENWCYIAFTPAREQGAKYAEILDAGIQRLRRNGRLDAILARYGVTDWARADLSGGQGE